MKSYYALFQMKNIKQVTSHSITICWLENGIHSSIRSGVPYFLFQVLCVSTTKCKAILVKARKLGAKKSNQTY